MIPRLYTAAELARINYLIVRMTLLRAIKLSRPDGPEERQADIEERFQRSLEEIDLAEQLADESRSEGDLPW